MGDRDAMIGLVEFAHRAYQCKDVDLYEKLVEKGTWEQKHELAHLKASFYKALSKKETQRLVWNPRLWRVAINHHVEFLELITLCRLLNPCIKELRLYFGAGAEKSCREMVRDQVQRMKEQAKDGWGKEDAAELARKKCTKSAMRLCLMYLYPVSFNCVAEMGAAQAEGEWRRGGQRKNLNYAFVIRPSAGRAKLQVSPYVTYDETVHPGDMNVDQLYSVVKSTQAKA